MSQLELTWLQSFANQVISGINSALAMAPAAQKHLKNLEHCSVKLQITGLNSAFYFGVTPYPESKLAPGGEARAKNYHVQFIDPTDNPEVLLSGSPLSLLKLFSQKDKAQLFKNKELSLQGESVRIQQVLAFIHALEIDWDGLLGKFIGDVPAHLIGTTLRTGLAWGVNLSQAFFRDAEEYIKYELRLLPDKNRARKQFSSIAALANAVQDLNARFDKLETETKQTQAKQTKES